MPAPEKQTRPPAQRRTQAERSAETQARLVAAAADCLTERGYAGTTTLEVCRRAEVSHGSLLHHFGTRNRLLAATLEHLYSVLREPVVSRLEALGSEPERLAALVDLMWGVFGSPEFKAVLELWLAAANSAELAAEVKTPASAFDQAIGPLTEHLFPELSARREDLLVHISLVFQALQGMGLARATVGRGGDEAMRDRVLALLGSLVADLADTPAGIDRAE